MLIARVQSIATSPSNMRTVTLVPLPMASEADAGQGKTYTVTYQFDAGEPEFIIRRDVFDRSLRHGWAVGMQFEQLFDTRWFVGKIVDFVHPPGERPWECLRVRWLKKHGKFVDDENMLCASPWEIRPTSDTRAVKRAKAGGARDVNDDDDDSDGSGADSSSSAAARRMAARKNTKLARSQAAQSRANAERMREIELWRENQLALLRKKDEEAAARAAVEAAAAASAAAAIAEAAERQRLEDEKRRQEEEKRAEEARAEEARLRDERLRRNQEMQAEQQKRNRELLEQRRLVEEERRRAEEASRKKQRYRYAMVCASNMNRSMEAHAVLQKKGYSVSSYGTGSQVKIPGRTMREPNVYEFGKVTYDDVYADIMSKNEDQFYRRNGILMLLERNRNTKRAPQKWQTTDFTQAENQVDVVFAFEERVYVALCEDLAQRGSTTMTPVMLINLEVVDNPEAATIGGQDALKLVGLIEAVDELEDGISGALEQFTQETGKPLLHTVAFF